MKRCPLCKRTLPLSEFNKRSSAADGHRSECRKCQSKEGKLYYSERGGRESHLRHYVLHREEKIAYMRGRPGGKPAPYNSVTGPARIAVYRAILSKRLVRPGRCEECGRECKPEGHHHNGYDKVHYLDVQWLCRGCHDKADHPEFKKELERVSKNHYLR